MFRSWFLSVMASVSLLANTPGVAQSQWFGRGMNAGCDCAPAPTAMMPASYSACGCDMPTVATVSACAPVVQTVAIPMQPVMQTVYQQVPVTEYRPEKQMVQRQVMETKYVDREVTAYRPITETRTAEVPTVSYQDVTEYQTVMRNMGYWRTRYEPNCKASPCQYDGRPGLMGWMNRTGYEFVSAFQPAYNVRREYCPQCVAQQVPVTRRVAIQGTRQVAYNVTRMEAYQTTQKVAILEPRMENVEVTVMKPITVVKTMAVGSQITYAPLGATGTATALQPRPDTIGRGTSPSRTAAGDKLDNANPNRVNDTRTNSLDRPMWQSTPLQRTGQPVEPVPPALKAKVIGTAQLTPPASSLKTTTSTFKVPSAARTSQWVARSTKAAPASPSKSESSALSVADSDRP
jgi:hypothetical protein